MIVGINSEYDHTAEPFSLLLRYIVVRYLSSASHHQWQPINSTYQNMICDRPAPHTAQSVSVKMWFWLRWLSSSPLHSHFTYIIMRHSSHINSSQVTITAHSDKSISRALTRLDLLRIGIYSTQSAHYTEPTHWKCLRGMKLLLLFLLLCIIPVLNWRRQREDNIYILRNGEYFSLWNSDETNRRCSQCIRHSILDISCMICYLMMQFARGRCTVHCASVRVHFSPRSEIGIQENNYSILSLYNWL